MVRFHLGPLLQGQTGKAKLKNLKVLITHLLLFLHVWYVKPTYTFLNYGRHLEFWRNGKCDLSGKPYEIEQFWANIGPPGN